MNANELRLGNFIKYFSDYEFSKITVLDHNYCHLDNASSIDYNDIHPIPLTEEILLKCGFEKETFCSYSTGEPINYNVYRNKKLTYNTSQNQWWINSSSTVSTTYLHQLQNLYFALTNEELTVNL